MDKDLLGSCIGLAAQIAAASGNMINKHADHVKTTVINIAFELHDEFQARIAQREAEEKARERFDFAKVAAEQAASAEKPRERSV